MKYTIKRAYMLHIIYLKNNYKNNEIPRYPPSSLRNRALPVVLNPLWGRGAVFSYLWLT